MFMRDRITFRPAFIAADTFVKEEYIAKSASPGARDGTRLFRVMLTSLIMSLMCGVVTSGTGEGGGRAYLESPATIDCYTSSGTWQNDPFANQTTPFVAH